MVAVIKKLDSCDLEATSSTDEGKVSKGRFSLIVSKGGTLLNHGVYEIPAKPTHFKTTLRNVLLIL